MSTALLADSSVTTTVISGPFLFAAAIALAAGVIAFASPCVLPLVPGYLSYLAGLVGAETAATAESGARGRSHGASPAGGTVRLVRRDALRGTALFVLGFTAVFLAESALVLGLSRTVQGNAETLTRIGGVVTILMGLAMLGFIRPLQREARVHAKPTGRFTGAVLLGAIFALGWTACLGPALVGINSLAITSEWNGNAWRGLLLVVAYCLGLGLPFLLLAAGFSWANGAIAVLRKHSRVLQLIGGLVMIAIGLAMVTGLWMDFMAWLRGFYPSGELIL